MHVRVVHEVTGDKVASGLIPDLGMVIVARCCSGCSLDHSAANEQVEDLSDKRDGPAGISWVYLAIWGGTSGEGGLIVEAERFNIRQIQLCQVGQDSISQLHCLGREGVDLSRRGISGQGFSSGTTVVLFASA